jgi:hypothetical protein
VVLWWFVAQCVAFTGLLVSFLNEWLQSAIGPSTDACSFLCPSPSVKANPPITAPAPLHWAAHTLKVFLRL